MAQKKQESRKNKLRKSSTNCGTDNKRIQLTRGSDTYFLKFEEIFYVNLIEGFRNHITVHLLCPPETIIVRSSLTKFLVQRLPTHLFYRANKDTIINWMYLVKIRAKNGEFSCTISNGDHEYTFKISQEAYYSILNSIQKTK